MQLSAKFEVYIARFLVTRTWFGESIEAFFSSTHFDLAWPCAAFAFLPAAVRFQLPNAELMRYVSLDLELVDDHLAKIINERCPHLRELHLFLDHFRLDWLPIFPGEDLEDDWINEARHCWVKYSPIREICRLQKVTLSICSPLRGEYGPCDEWLLKNIQMMEDVLRQWLTPRDQGSPVL